MTTDQNLLKSTESLIPPLEYHTEMHGGDYDMFPDLVTTKSVHAREDAIREKLIKMRDYYGDWSEGEFYDEELNELIEQLERKD